MNIKSFQKTALITTLGFCLVACSGSSDKMSFTNSDTFLESYRSVTKDMTESERKIFRRNLFLVAFDNTPNDGVTTLRDVQQAWEYERTTLDLNADGATPLASEFALRGAALNGKTVAEINALGETQSDLAVSNEITDLESKRADVEKAISQLEADKVIWQERKALALKEEARLIKEGQAYGVTVSGLRITKEWNGPNIQGRFDVTGKADDPATRVKAQYLVEHKGYVARYSQFTLMNRLRGQKLPLNLSLQPKSFLNAKGKPLADDYVFPMDINEY